MILITGGAGFIGSHTALALIENGYEVLIIDNLTNSSIDSINSIQKITGKSVTFLEGDLRDEIFLKTVFDEYQITDVIHFAGVKSVGESNDNPIYYYDNNVTGTLTLIKEMAKGECRNLIFSSSATVYGEPSALPIKENFPLSTTNPYGQSKLFIEKILCDLKNSNSGWNILVLRYFNPAGAHASGLLGEAPNQVPNNLFPLVSQVAAGHTECLNIYGGQYATKDGTGVRDYIHICDLAEGHVKALKVLPNQTQLLTVNLGTGCGYSVIEIIKEFEKVSGHKIPYKILGNRKGDVAACYADASYAEKIMDWKAKRTLTDMCKDQWRWETKTL